MSATERKVARFREIFVATRNSIFMWNKNFFRDMEPLLCKVSYAEPHSTAILQISKHFVTTASPKRYVRVKAIRYRARVQDHFLGFIEKFERISLQSVSREPVDNVPEQWTLRDLLHRKDIYLTTSSAYNFQSNGIVKRLDSWLFSNTSFLMKQADIS